MHERPALVHDASCLVLQARFIEQKRALLHVSTGSAPMDGCDRAISSACCMQLHHGCPFGASTGLQHTCSQCSGKACVYCKSPATSSSAAGRNWITLDLFSWWRHVLLASSQHVHTPSVSMCVSADSLTQCQTRTYQLISYGQRHMQTSTALPVTSSEAVPVEESWDSICQLAVVPVSLVDTNSTLPNG